MVLGLALFRTTHLRRVLSLAVCLVLVSGVALIGWASSPVVLYDTGRNQFGAPTAQVSSRDLLDVTGESVCWTKEKEGKLMVADDVPIRSPFLVVDTFLHAFGQGLIFLEIGTRHGDISSCLRTFDYEVYAIENDAVYCEYLEHRGIPVVCEDALQIFAGRNSSVIPLADVDIIFWWLGNRDLEESLIEALKTYYDGAAKVPRVFALFDTLHTGQWWDQIEDTVHFMRNGAQLFAQVRYHEEQRYQVTRKEWGDRKEGNMLLLEFFV